MYHSLFPIARHVRISGYLINRIQQHAEKDMPLLSADLWRSKPEEQPCTPQKNAFAYGETNIFLRVSNL